MTELENVKTPFITSLALSKGEIREGSKSSINKRTYPNLSLKK